MNKTTEREKEILRILQRDPMISQEALADIVGITRSAVAVHISNLIKKGFILGRGYVFNDRTGVLVIAPVFMDVTVVDRPGTGSSAEIEILPAGSGYRMAGCLAAQGVPTSLLTVLGRDDWGGIIGDKLKEKGVDNRFMVIQNEYPTPRRVSVFDSHTGHRQLFSDQRALRYLNGEITHKLTVTAPNCRMLVVDGEIPSETLSQIVNTGREAETPICMVISSGAWIDAGNSVYGVSMAVLTDIEAQNMVGIKIDDFGDGITACKVLNEMGVETAVVFITNQGVVMSRPGETLTVPLSPIQQPHGFDEEYGSGVDILAAGLISGLLHGCDIRQSIRLGMGLMAHDDGNSRNLSERQEKY